MHKVLNTNSKYMLKVSCKCLMAEWQCSFQYFLRLLPACLIQCFLYVVLDSWYMDQRTNDICILGLFIRRMNTIVCPRMLIES
jgi:hypothetical protein